MDSIQIQLWVNEETIHSSMHKLALAITIFVVTTGAGFSADPQRSLAGSWKLVWQDEFDGKALDRTKWNVLLREHSKHNELQYYLPDDVYLENGCLRLRSRVRDFGSQHYTSGRVDTCEKLAPVYGRFEIRAKLPAGKGLWPAHWLYPQNRDWKMEMLMAEAVAAGKERLIPEERPWYTEIDIMEFLGHEPARSLIGKDSDRRLPQS